MHETSKLTVGIFDVHLIVEFLGERIDFNLIDGSLKQKSLTNKFPFKYKHNYNCTNICLWLYLKQENMLGQFGLCGKVV